MSIFITLDMVPVNAEKYAVPAGDPATAFYVMAAANAGADCLPRAIACVSVERVAQIGMAGAREECLEVVYEALLENSRFVEGSES